MPALIRAYILSSPENNVTHLEQILSARLGAVIRQSSATMFEDPHLSDIIPTNAEVRNEQRDFGMTMATTNGTTIPPDSNPWSFESVSLSNITRVETSGADSSARSATLGSNQTYWNYPERYSEPDSLHTQPPSQARTMEPFASGKPESLLASFHIPIDTFRHSTYRILRKQHQRTHSGCNHPDSGPGPDPGPGPKLGSGSGPGLGWTLE